ncbi:hypothetical protein BGZ63DRAFT_362228 [Mariannaea sp. PMI_226]|nr:hypothetical protein BGZ63DRAFT_362228 [Mariannaea sp. PMI_226]
MASRAPLLPSRPQSIKELVAQAENFTFNSNIPFKHWTRAAETLYQEASFAVKDGDYGRAYMMLYRHSVLVLQFLPSHPQTKDPESKKAYRPLQKRITRVIQDLEDLKPEIENAYKEWERLAPKGLAETPHHASKYAEFAARDPSLSGNARILDAFENQDLAVDLAQRELFRRDTARRATRQAGIKEDDVLSRRMGGRWDTWDTQSRLGDDDDLQRQMEATRQALDSAQERRHADQDYRPTSTSSYNYPSISRSKPVDFEQPRYPASTPPLIPSKPPRQPERPPKDDLQPPPLVPLVPRKVPLAQYQPLTPTPPPPPKQLDDRPSLPPKEELSPTLPHPKKERLTFKPGAYLENGDPVRSLFLPKDLRQTFLDIASENTRQGLEMCGILCGTPINNALFVRCLLIPEQKCTSDTCETQNETSMFDYCMNEDLLVLGWIHTHPTQTCFMSSRDLHTQSGYQVMMPESVAIVCAPKFKPSYVKKLSLDLRDIVTNYRF